jgi:hypothetical protein
MRIGSLFLILLMTFVAFGYLLSDSAHLREELSNLKKDFERLTYAVTQSEQEKQKALMDLRSCQQSVSQLKQIIAENDNLKNQSLNVINPALQTKVVQSTTFDVITFTSLGLGSMGMIVLEIIQKQPLFKRHTIRKERYILLTQAETEEVVRWRRRVSQLPHPKPTRDFREGGEP